VATCLVALAVLAPARGQPRRAAVLFGAAERLRGVIGVALPPFIRDEHDTHVAAARAAIAAAAFESAWSRGREMPLEQAVAFALSDEG
jgi:hypothetical protein